MKRKRKNKRKIKPKSVHRTNGEADLHSYGPFRLHNTPVFNIIHGYQSERNQALSYGASERTDSDDKRNKVKSWIKNRKLKLLNLIGYIGIVVGCMYQCFSFLTIYFSYPTTVEMNVTNDNIMDFPAVTICNSNPVKYKVWCKEDKNDLCSRRQNETLEEYDKRIADMYNRLEKEERIRYGYSREEFIILAEYNNESVVNKFQQYYDYEFTNCFTFNGAWGNNKFLEQAIVFNPVTGKSTELILCANMDIENYSNISGGVVARAKMTIHANDIIPNPSYDAASLEAGSFYAYGIQKVTNKLLKAPYQTKCRNYEDEKEYRTGAKMSQKNCLLECFKTETEAICGCTYRRLALMYDALPCDVLSQYDCLSKEETRVFELCNSQCPMACQKVQFTNVATDSEPLREESPIYDRMHIKNIFPTQEIMNENMACMRIHYGSTETKVLNHHPKYPFIELFSLLGGYSGLWLGFSLLNVHEFALTKLIYFYKKRKKQQKQKRKTKRRVRRRYY